METRKRTLLWTATGVVVVAAAVALWAFQPWRLFTTVRVDEASTGGQRLTAGTFVSHEHETSGTAEIRRSPDGSAMLRITDLRTSDGPALRVYLSDQPVRPDTGGNLDDGRFVDLGELKGNEGNQNYAIPSRTDLGDLSTVSIWCERFSVSFGAAALR